VAIVWGAVVFRETMRTGPWLAGAIAGAAAMSAAAIVLARSPATTGARAAHEEDQPASAALPPSYRSGPARAVMAGCWPSLGTARDRLGVRLPRAHAGLAAAGQLAERAGEAGHRRRSARRAAHTALVNSLGALGGFAGAYVVGALSGTSAGVGLAFIVMGLCLLVAAGPAW
jgi:hypothetical protein